MSSLGNLTCSKTIKGKQGMTKLWSESPSGGWGEIKRIVWGEENNSMEPLGILKDNLFRAGQGDL